MTKEERGTLSGRIIEGLSEDSRFRFSFEP
jgi:hypothetical protein